MLRMVSTYGNDTSSSDDSLQILDGEVRDTDRSNLGNMDEQRSFDRSVYNLPWISAVKSISSM